MDNQEKYNQDTTPNEVLSTPAYSTSRRVFTVALVLIAALLLGYVLYSNLMQDVAPVPPVPEEAVEPEPTEQEIAVQRLESLQSEGIVELSPEITGQLEAAGSEAQPPDEAAVARLESLQ